MATIKLRRGTAADWTAANPVLALGEYGHETDTGKSKIGDGTTAWKTLAYLGEWYDDATRTLANKTIDAVLAFEAATGTRAVISTTGVDADVDLNVTPKGAGKLLYNGSEVLTSATGATVTVVDGGTP